MISPSKGLLARPNEPHCEFLVSNAPCRIFRPWHAVKIRRYLIYQRDEGFPRSPTAPVASYSIPGVPSASLNSPGGLAVRLPEHARPARTSACTSLRSGGHLGPRRARSHTLARYPNIAWAHRGRHGVEPGFPLGRREIPVVSI